MEKTAPLSLAEGPLSLGTLISHAKATSHNVKLMPAQWASFKQLRNFNTLTTAITAAPSSKAGERGAGAAQKTHQAPPW